MWSKIVIKEQTESPQRKNIEFYIVHVEVFLFLLQSGDGNKDRVEAFIDGAADYVHVSPPGSPSGGESQSDVSASPAGQGGVVPQFHFLLDPSHRDAFITVFRLAKKRHLGQGFAV